ncbi:MAG TPA: DUF4129 domain-containing protein [Smithellaceae bacterium]|nr:DUF4129 domain-containing protein [Smithellaceae bacterium]
MVNRYGKQLIFIAGAAMELCWLQAWNGFLMQSIFGCRASLGFLIVIYFSGALIHRAFINLQWVRILMLLTQLIVFAAVFFIAAELFIFRYNGMTLISGIPRLGDDSGALMGWLMLLVLLVIAAISWLRSRALILRPLSLENVYLRFDLGLAAVFMLLVVKAKFGVAAPGQNLIFFHIPLFLFGLLTTGLILNSGRRERSYAAGLQKISVVIGFAVAMLIAGIGIFFLMHSQMMDSAEAISGSVKKAGPSVLRIIGWSVDLLSSSRRSAEFAGTSSDSLNSLNVAAGEGPAILTDIVIWGGSALFIFVIVVVLLVIIRNLLEFLLARNKAVKPQKSHSFNFRRLLIRIRNVIYRIMHRLYMMVRKIKTASDIYACLAAWGGKSGIPVKKSDTLLEYGNRLAGIFPALAAEINLLVQLVQQEIYGEVKLDSAQMAAARKAKRRMNSPRYWKSRIKVWVFSPGN